MAQLHVSLKVVILLALALPAELFTLMPSLIAVQTPTTYKSLASGTGGAESMLRGNAWTICRKNLRWKTGGATCMKASGKEGGSDVNDDVTDDDSGMVGFWQLMDDSERTFTAADNIVLRVNKQVGSDHLFFFIFSFAGPLTRRESPTCSPVIRRNAQVHNHLTQAPQQSNMLAVCPVTKRKRNCGGHRVM